MTASERAKDKRLQKQYKMTLEEQNKRKAEQGNRCAICGRPFPPLKNEKGQTFTPYQDHEHKCCPTTGKNKVTEYCGRCNRGLLCFLCNKYLVGVLEKQNLPVDKLFEYVKKWKKILTEKGCYEKEAKEVSRK